MATLTPAYGRDYKSKKDAEKDFRDGKDFIYNDVSSPHCGKPCSIRDFKKGEKHQIRYKRNTQVAIVTV